MHAGGHHSGFSIICAYNDAAKLERLLLKSTAAQRNAPFELILLDNRHNQYPAAAPAFNAAAQRARYDHLLFVHQDVSLTDSLWLATVNSSLATLPHLGAAGVAGRDEHGIMANVTHGTPPRRVGVPISEPRPVQTLDGCLLIVPTAVFASRGFDETTALGWYLYVMDYCLDQLRAGLRNYVLPQAVYHESTGPEDASRYADTLARILRKNRGHIDTIYGTMGIWTTSQTEKDLSDAQTRALETEADLNNWKTRALETEAEAAAPCRPRNATE